MSGTADWLVAGSAVASTCFVGGATLLGIRQLREAHKANRLAALTRVADILRDPPIMKARRWLFANEDRLEGARYDDLDAEETAMVEDVWRAYDQVALLFDYQLLIDEKPVLDMWAISIVRVVQITATLLADRRAKGNPYFVHNLESLRARAEQYLVETGRQQ